LIDQARFGPNAGNELLGAADYKLVHHCANGRSAYSFCMCPGGQVVAATSEEGRVVTNGMSQYSRAERNANAALVVNVNPEGLSRRLQDQPAGRHRFSAAMGISGFRRRRQQLPHRPSASAIFSPAGRRPHSAQLIRRTSPACT
jgi:hypothetical protein